MSVGVGFVILMVVLGGVVAAVGDYLGRVIGKKRLNLLNLRPKHTAILMTFLAGMGGTLVVISLLSALAAPVRSWIIEGDRARVERDRARKDLAGVKGQVEEQNKHLGDVQGQLTAKSAELDAANKQKEEVEAKATEAKTEADKARADAEEVRKEVASTRAELRSTVAELSAAKDNLTKAAADLQKAKAEQTALLAANEKLKGESEKLVVANKALALQNTDLETQLQTLRVEITGLKSNLLSLQNDQQVTTGQLKATQENLAQANATLEEARKKVEAAQSQVKMIESQAYQLGVAPRFYAMTIRVKDELARGVIEAGADEATVRQQVASLLLECSRFARARNGDPLARIEANLIDIQRADNTFNTVANQVDELVRSVRATREPTLLIARAWVNVFRSENAPVSLEAIPNRVVYVPGQVMFEGRVDGSAAKGQIIQQLTVLINEGLRAKALRDGIVPATGQELELGQISSEQILEIADRLSQYGRPGRVQFVAAAPTRRGDHLKIEYRLKP